MSRKTGILGGSFNPPHLGHLTMALDVLERHGLDRVVFIPAATPPHKMNQCLADAENRMAMVRLAIADEPRFEVSDEEIRRGGVSYTVDTLRHFRDANPGDELFLIIGGDTLRELHTWKDTTEILAMARVITVFRPGVDAATLRPSLPEPWPERLMADVMTGHPLGISSTDIRRRVSGGLSIRYLVPQAVERYIREKKLYHS